MPTGIRAASAFTNRTGMRRVRRLVAAPGTIRDYLFYGYPDGTTTIPSLTGTGSLVLHGAQIMRDSFGTFARFTASESDYADDTSVGVLAQPFTFVLRARMRTPVASRVLMGSHVSGRSTIATTSGNVFQGQSGVALPASGASDSGVHTFLYTSDGATSIFSKDGVEVTGNAGAGLAEGLRLAATSAGVYTDLDVYRVAIVPYHPTTDQRADLVSIFSA